MPVVKGYVQITSDRVRKFGPLTDGARVYFTESSVQSAYVPVQVAAAGGEVARIPVPFAFAVVSDVSADGSELLMHGEREPLGTDQAQARLWTVPVLGGAPRPVGDVRAEDAAWSRDGKQIAYTVGPDVFVCGADGSHPLKVWTAPASAYAPSWSPDGRRLRLTVVEGQSGMGSLFEVRTDGGDARRLLPGFPRAACCGRWTPDGRHFVFQAVGDRTMDVWALPESTGWRSRREPVRLTNGPLDFYHPVASPDGRRLFVVGVKQGGELVRFDASTGQFVTCLGGVSAQGIDFSRDGRSVAYVTFPEGALWRSRADGGDRLQLTVPPHLAALPRWSPDGTRIAFSGMSPGKPWEIHVVSAEGGTSEPLGSGDRNEADPSWSPDGRTLAFGYSLREHTAGRPITIQMLDLASGRVTTVPGSEGLFSPRWSPDGKHLAALSNDSFHLLLYDLQAGAWRELLASRQWIAYPSWDKEGQHLFVREGTLLVREGTLRLRLGIADGGREVVANLEGLRQPAGFWGEWIGQGPDDLVLLALRDMSIQELFALEWAPP